MTDVPDYAEAGVTPELFRQWRSPRFGRSNPEVMNNPVWEWLVRTRINAYHANMNITGESSCDVGPTWCFDRFGQSKTSLDDGREVLIAGEHEDWYDPDFYIYNDVVVLAPDGSITIHGYPEDVFPPTDHHSATLVGDRIVLVGNLGPVKARVPGWTQVLVLALRDFSMKSVEPSGTAPGWIHRHDAVLSADGQSLLITGGEVHIRDDADLVENIDDWRLWLDEWRWERLTDRRWPRWTLSRSDGKPHALWELRQALWEREVGWKKELADGLRRLSTKLGVQPDLDMVPTLYRPAIPHEDVPEREDEYGVHRIVIDDVPVRYVESSGSVRVTVEGYIPQPTIDALKSDLFAKLQQIDGSEWTLETIDEAR